MYLHTLLILLNFSVTIPAAILFLRAGTKLRDYWPFAIFIWGGLLSDVFSYVLILKTQSNMVSANVYIFIEYCLILIQIAIWKRQPVWHYVLFGLLGIMVWLFDNLYLNKVTGNNSIFRLFYSLAIVLFSLDLFNRNIIYERSTIIKNPVFLICTGFILYYGCKAFLESFNIFHAGLSDLFFIRLFLILSVVNLLSNIIYAYAILCIPKKPEFTMPY